MDSIPTDDYTQPDDEFDARDFYLRAIVDQIDSGADVPVNKVLLEDWDEHLPNDPDHDGYLLPAKQWFGTEAPTYPLSGGRGLLCGAIMDVDYNMMNWPLTSAGTFATAVYAGGPEIFRISGPGSAFWTYHLETTHYALHQGWRYLNDMEGTYGFNSCFQNVGSAARVRYRTDGRYVGWEASCDLWAQYLDLGDDPPTVWLDGWRPFDAPGNGIYPPGFDMTNHRTWAKNWTWRRAIRTIAYPYPTLTNEHAIGWNYIPLPAHNDPEFYKVSPVTHTLMNGFLGRAIFHIFEPEEVWTARTGWEVSHPAPYSPRGYISEDRIEINTDRELL